jgi:CheY-like chemotaxis protein
VTRPGSDVRTVLLAEDNPITRKLVRFTLEAQRFVVVEAVDGAEALRAFDAHDVSLVLLDLWLPDMDGFALLEQLRAKPKAAAVPMLAFTGMLAQDLEARISASGFDDIISKPIEPSRLVQIVTAHLPPTEPAPPRARTRSRRIVIADDDPVQRRLVAMRLERGGYEVIATANGQEALDRARAVRPDAIVSDVLMPTLDGFGLCVALRNDAALSSIPVVLVTNSYLEAADRELASRVGANKLVLRTPDLREVLEVLESAIGKPAALGPVKIDAEVERERVTRAMHQLERQVALNAGANQRSALLSAELSVLSGISEAVAARHDVEGAIREVLAACFDAGGISLGALFLTYGPSQRVFTFGAQRTSELESFFGERASIDAAIKNQTVLVASSPDGDPRMQAVLERSGVT